MNSDSTHVNFDHHDKYFRIKNINLDGGSIYLANDFKVCMPRTLGSVVSRSLVRHS